MGCCMWGLWVLMLIEEAEKGAQDKGIFDGCGCFLDLVGWNILGGKVGEEGGLLLLVFIWFLVMVRNCSGF